MGLILMVLMPDMDTKVVNVITIVDGIFMLVAFVDYIRAYFDKRTKFIYLEKD